MSGAENRAWRAFMCVIFADQPNSALHAQWRNVFAEAIQSAYRDNVQFLGDDDGVTRAHLDATRQYFSQSDGHIAQDRHQTSTSVDVPSVPVATTSVDVDVPLIPLATKTNATSQASQSHSQDQAPSTVPGSHLGASSHDEDVPTDQTVPLQTQSQQAGCSTDIFRDDNKDPMDCAEATTKPQPEQQASSSCSSTVPVNLHPKKNTYDPVSMTKTQVAAKHQATILAASTNKSAHIFDMKIDTLTAQHKLLHILIPQDQQLAAPPPPLPPLFPADATEEKPPPTHTPGETPTPVPPKPPTTAPPPTLFKQQLPQPTKESPPEHLMPKSSADKKVTFTNSGSGSSQAVRVCAKCLFDAKELDEKAWIHQRAENGRKCTKHQL